MISDERRPTSASSQDDVLATIRTMLLGSKRVRPRQALLLGLGLGFFIVTFLGYELDIFYHSGGVVFIPFHAALVGVIGAFWTGYTRTGLLFGWGLTYLSFLGWRTEWATNISPRPLIERIAYVVQPDGLAALAIIGVGVAVLGFIGGTLTRAALNMLWAGHQTTTNN